MTEERTFPVVEVFGPTLDEIERFWSYVNKTSTCWLWTGGGAGSEASPDYGAFWYRGKLVGAHRFSLALSTGDWPKHFACHTCDVPSCVRPDHLFDGTVQANMQDASQKGRMQNSQGTSKLSWDEVVRLRETYGHVWTPKRGPKSSPSLSQIAREFGISEPQVWAILTGRSYLRAGVGRRGGDAL